MDLKTRINTDIKAALLAGDKARVKTLRSAMAAVKQREIDERVTLDDSGIIAIFDKMIKQRRDAIEQFRAGGREDLASAEASEIELLSAYMPEPLGEAELAALIDAAIAETGAQSMQDMGNVMGDLRAKIAGRADMAVVSGQVRERLKGSQ